MVQQSKSKTASRTLGLGIALMLGTVVLPAAAASEFAGGYVGADAGMSRDKVSGTVSSENKSAFGGGLEAGYNWDLDNSWLFGVNGFLVQSQKKDRDIGANTSIDFGSRTYGLDGKLGVAMDKWLPYVKLGYGRIKGTEDADSYSERGAHLGLGLEYKLDTHWSLGGELTRLRGREDAGDKLTNNNLFLTLKYYFDGKPPAPAPVAAAPVAPAPVAPPPKPAPRKEKYTLSASELFAFDSAELKMPQPKLDEIAAALQGNPQVSSVAITGHTDRLGSEKYNQGLSERRAEAVKAYLVGKGIDAARLNAIGKGESSPVVECKERKRAKLIVCLEPNRRVEVEELTFERTVE